MWGLVGELLEDLGFARGFVRWPRCARVRGGCDLAVASPWALTAGRGGNALLYRVLVTPQTLPSTWRDALPAAFKGRLRSDRSTAHPAGMSPLVRIPDELRRAKIAGARACCPCVRTEHLSASAAAYVATAIPGLFTFTELHSPGSTNTRRAVRRLA